MTLKTALLATVLFVAPTIAAAMDAPIPGMTAREYRVLTRGGKRSIASLSKACGTITDVNFLVKADSSNHIPGGDTRRGSYSVIGSTANCRPLQGSGTWSIIYANGKSAGSVGYYGTWSRSHGGNGCNRYYGGAGGAPAHSANSIISSARRNGGNLLYLRKTAGSKKGPCYRWTASSRRVGFT